MNLFLTLSLLLFATGFGPRRHPPAGPETFVASTPCDALPRSLLGITAQADCEFIKWRLVLNRDGQTAQPTTFTLGYRYGMSLPGTQGFQGGGSQAHLTGTWAIQSEANLRTVYRLTPQSGAPLHFL